ALIEPPSERYYPFVILNRGKQTESDLGRVRKTDEKVRFALEPGRLGKAPGGRASMLCSAATASCIYRILQQRCAKCCACCALVGERQSACGTQPALVLP